jgi:hypothetical protein
MMSNISIPAVGQLVRVGSWIGVVLEVFASETSDKHIARINFVKNIYKQQPPELHILENIENVLTVATVQDLEQEIERYEKRKQEELEALRDQAKVTT